MYHSEICLQGLALFVPDSWRKSFCLVWSQLEHPRLWIEIIHPFPISTHYPNLTSFVLRVKCIQRIKELKHRGWTLVVIASRLLNRYPFPRRRHGEIRMVRIRLNWKSREIIFSESFYTFNTLSRSEYWDSRSYTVLEATEISTKSIIMW